MHCDRLSKVSFSSQQTSISAWGSSSLQSDRSDRGLVRSMRTVEALGLALSLMSLTLSMSFLVPLAVQTAGTAAPLAFLVSGAAMIVIAFSFLAFSREIAHAGSVYAFVGSVFGARWGFLTAWVLLLSYAGGCTATFALTGNFAAASLAHLGLHQPHLWLLVAAPSGVLTVWLALRQIGSITHLMLGLECISILAIVALGVVILRHNPGTLAPFHPDPHRGLSGIGAAMVFAVFCYSGFEGAATLGEETYQPRRAISIAMISALLVAIVVYVFSTYTQLVGYGMDRIQALADAPAPLDSLSTRYISGGYGAFLDFAAALSAFACSLGLLTAAARLLYALSRGGLSRRLNAIDKQHACPRPAVLLIGLLSLVCLLTFGSWAGAQAYSDAVYATTGLAIILVYMAMCFAQGVHAFRTRRAAGCLLCTVGLLVLCWPLANSLYPVPAWPRFLWPLLNVGWLGAGLLLLVIRPQIAQASLRDVQTDMVREEPSLEAV